MLSIDLTKLPKKVTPPVSSDIYLVTGFSLFWCVRAFLLAPAPFCGGHITPPHPHLPPLQTFARPPWAAAAKEAADAVPAIAATRTGWPPTLAAPRGRDGVAARIKGHLAIYPGGGYYSLNIPLPNDDNNDNGGG